MFKTSKYWITLALLNASQPVQAASTFSQNEVSFSPYIGSGSISDDSQVRHTSGYAVSYEYNWTISGFSIGPRIEFINAGMSTKSTNDNLNTQRTYDSDILAAGLRLTTGVHPMFTPLNGFYLSVLAGMGNTKITENESSTTTYMQNSFTGAKGTYDSIEVGSLFAIKGSFGISAAVISSNYHADFTSAKGTRQGDSLNDAGKVFSLKEDIPANANGFPDSSRLTSSAFKIGLVLGF